MKNPLDQSKKSKSGRLKLVEYPKGYFKTEKVESDDLNDDFMKVVFENGQIVQEYTFDEIRERCSKIV